MKKILSIFTALVLIVACMAVPAFAAGTEVAIELPAGTKIVAVDNDAAFPVETYDFTLTPADAIPAKNIQEGVAITASGNTGISVASAEKQEMDADHLYGDHIAGDDYKTAALEITGTATFTAPGTYHYILTEAIPETADQIPTEEYNVGEKSYDIIVYVGYADGSDELTQLACYAYDHEDFSADLFDVQGNGTDTAKKVNPEFVNSLKSTSLKVSKTVTGSLGDPNKMFDFTLKTTGNAAYPAGTVIPATVVLNHDGTATNQTAKLTIGTDYTFQLNDGDYIDFVSLPVGVDYTIEEADYSDDGYATTEQHNAEAATEARTYTGSFTEDAQTDAFVNNNGVTPTGVFMSYGPAIMITLIALAAGTALIVFSKKRKASEC